MRSAHLGRIRPMRAKGLRHHHVRHTASASEPARAVDGAVVAFEADAADVETHSGWSVVTGRAEIVTDPADAAGLERVGPHAWVPSPEEVFVRIESELVTGRELVGGRTVCRVHLSA